MLPGKLVNLFSSKKDSTFKKYDGGPSAEPLLAKKKGMNRFVWNTRHQSLKGVPTAYIEGQLPWTQSHPWYIRADPEARRQRKQKQL